MPVIRRQYVPETLQGRSSEEYDETVQRISAIVLLVLFGFSPIVPAFPDANSKLPECCRRDGKHHCGAADQQASPSGVVVKAGWRKCASFPKGGAVPSHSKTVLLNAAQTGFAPILTCSIVQAHIDAFYRISFERSHQKRGPPALLSQVS
jgi:hypothetical protein